jgi:hypothetical protein
MYFRTEKNKYGLEIIVAVETDATLVNSTGNNWLESDDPDCASGAYWVNGQCVNTSSSDYDELVGTKIAAAREEADAAVRAASQAEAERQVAEAEQLIVEKEKIAAMQDEDEVIGIEIPTLEEMKVRAKTLSKPVHVPIRERKEGIPEITLENLAIWEEILADTKRTIDGVINDTDPDPDIVRFPEPITYLEGTPEELTVEFIVLADEDKESYLAHWRIVEADQEAWVAHMKSKLGV